MLVIVELTTGYPPGAGCIFLVNPFYNGPIKRGKYSFTLPCLRNDPCRRIGIVKETWRGYTYRFRAHTTVDFDENHDTAVEITLSPYGRVISTEYAKMTNTDCKSAMHNWDDAITYGAPETLFAIYYRKAV